MPLLANEIQEIHNSDALHSGKDKLNYNFEILRQFVNSLESGAGGGGTSSSAKIDQPGHGFVIGSVVRHNGLGYVPASSDTMENAEVLGMVTDRLSVREFVLTFSGRVEGLASLVPGEVYYLQDNGSLGVSPGTVSRAILVATSTTTGVLVNEYRAGSVSTLSDVDMSSVDDGDTLRYNSSTSKWDARGVSMRELDDVDLPSVVPNGHALIFSSYDNTWKAIAIPGGGNMSTSVYDVDGDGIIDEANRAYSVPWAGVTGTPSSYPPSHHTHGVSDITSLDNVLNTKVNTSRSITTGVGLSGGGSLSSDISLRMSLSSLRSKTSVADADYIVGHDSSGTPEYRVTFANLKASIGVPDLSNLSASNLTSGTVPAARIGAGSITNTHIASLATSKLTGTITKTQMASNSVGTSQIENLAVTGAKIENGTITGDKIATSISGQHTFTSLITFNAGIILPIL